MTWCGVCWQCVWWSLPFSFKCTLGVLLGNVGFISRSGSVTLIKRAWLKKWLIGNVTEGGVRCQRGPGLRVKTLTRPQRLSKFKVVTHNFAALSLPLFVLRWNCACLLFFVHAWIFCDNTNMFHRSLLFEHAKGCIRWQTLILQCVMWKIPAP